MTRLLISVRSADEALDAVEAGADIIDVKEPDRGALGRADPECVRSVHQAIGDQVPVSMACGELVENPSEPILPSLSYAKIGLANCVPSDPNPTDPEPRSANYKRKTFSWQTDWRRWIESIPPSVQPIAVIYADSWNAQSPSALEIIALSQEMNCPGVLVDTFRKQKQRSLFDWQDAHTISKWVDAAHRGSQFFAIAGSLTAEHFPLAMRMNADIIALRGAACEEDRSGRICKQKIRDLSNALALANPQRTFVQRDRKDAQDGMSSRIF